MNIIAGIDGGGTGTVLDLCDLNGKPLHRMKFGPFNLNSIGKERFRLLLQDIFKIINETGTCVSICIGAAGISNPAVGCIINEEAGKALPSCKLLLRGDHEIALYGATGGNPGSILIAGTGSICIGMNETGKTVRAGGWGHLIDDVGSGYALGRDALSAVVQSLDGRRQKTSLTELIFDMLDVPDITSLISYVYDSFDKSRIAALSPLVEQAGRMGDEAALEILQQSGHNLADLVAAVYMQLGVNGMSLSLLGGLLVNDTLLRESVINSLKIRLPAVQVKAPQTDAAGGAALMALRNL